MSIESVGLKLSDGKLTWTQARVNDQESDKLGAVMVLFLNKVVTGRA